MMINMFISNIHNTIKSVDKLLQGNLFANMTAGLTSLAGIFNFNYISMLMSRENVVSWCLTISAVTGAIYGIYRIADLLYKGINKLKEKK